MADTRQPVIPDQKPENLTVGMSGGKSVTANLPDLGSKMGGLSSENQVKWDALKQLGVTEKTMIERHPEIVQARDDVEKSSKRMGKYFPAVVMVATTLGVIIPLAMFKNSEGVSKGIKRGATALVTGGAGAIAGGFGAAYGFGKSIQKKVDALDKVEAAALDQELAKASLAVGVQPRDAGHAAQVTKEAAQTSTPGVSA